MKRLHVIAGICVLAVALFFAFRNLGGAGESSGGHELDNLPAGSRNGRRPANARPGSPSTGPKQRGDGRRELPGIASSIQKQPSPAGVEAFVVSLDGEIRDGETLVTGGNLGRDGSHELTLITPTIVQLADGKEAVRVDMKVIAANAEFIEENGLRSIGMNAQSALQVAEAWRMDQTNGIIESAHRQDDSSLLSAPTVFAVPGQPFTINVGGVAGSSYTLHGTFSVAGSGGFRFQSRLERSIPPNKPK